MKYFAIFSSVILCKSLQTCDFFPVPVEKCPDAEKLGALPKCSNARAGELCEGGGEFCTSNILDNCLENDVYIKRFPVKHYLHQWQVCDIESDGGCSSGTRCAIREYSQHCVSVLADRAECEVKLPLDQKTIAIKEVSAFDSFALQVNQTFYAIGSSLPRELRNHTIRTDGSIRIRWPENFGHLFALVLCIPMPSCGKGDILKDVNIMECPSITSIQALPSCKDATFGSLCEADGECGTDPELDNCPGEYDVYRKHSSQGSQGSTRTILP